MRREKLDLRGEVCPYTLVRAKLALEDDRLEIDDELDIVVDHKPAWRSLPGALREEGHEVLFAKAATDESIYTIRVRKRPQAADEAPGY